MLVNFRDYYTFLSISGLPLWLHGFYRYTAIPQCEVGGGGQMIAGVFIALFGLLLLKSDTGAPGLTDMLVDKLMLRFRVFPK